MRKRINLTVLLLLLTASFCHARALTEAEADTIIFILSFIVIVLVVLGVIGMHYHKIINRRNEQLQRILNTLNDYRAILGDESLLLDEQEVKVEEQQPEKPAAAPSVAQNDSKAFYVKMDALLNKEKPFTDPDFDQQALAAFMGVGVETFRKLVPRYEGAARTLDYINSLRAEYAAKILMEHTGFPMDDIPSKCGFRDAAAFVSAFKFAFGITPTDYLNSMSQMFKKKA